MCIDTNQIHQRRAIDSLIRDQELELVLLSQSQILGIDSICGFNHDNYSDRVAIEGVIVREYTQKAISHCGPISVLLDSESVKRES